MVNPNQVDIFQSGWTFSIVAPTEGCRCNRWWLTGGESPLSVTTGATGWIADSGLIVKESNLNATLFSTLFALYHPMPDPPDLIWTSRCLVGTCSVFFVNFHLSEFISWALNTMHRSLLYPTEDVRIVPTNHWKVVRFLNPLASGSGLGAQYP